MEPFELVLLMIAAVLISSVLGQLLPKISLPLIEILVGVILALFATNDVDISFDSDLFLVVFIAPLLYDEARHADRHALLSNIRVALSYAIGLVLVTIFAVGFAVHWLIPAVPFTVACMLGAALGPTDAIAVSSLPKDINIGKRRREILEAEFLLNDASGIVGFQFALAATLTGSFSIAEASWDFVVCFVGGILVGIVLGFAGNYLEKFIRRIGLENTTFHVLYDILLPFIIYLFAEPLGASGIIAVVVGGLIRALHNESAGPSPSRMKIVSSSVWQTISFALNGIVFVLLGTQLPKAMRHTLVDTSIDNGQLLLYIFAIVAVILATRYLWSLAEEFIFRAQNKEKLVCADAFRSALIMTLAGPKGAVTLAVIFTVPVLLSSEAFFPERSLIIFLSCGVILVTLLLSNYVLPLVVPKVPAASTAAMHQQADVEANIAILRRVIEQLTAHQTPENRNATQKIIAQYNNRISRIKDKNNIEEAYNVELRMTAFSWERVYIMERLNDGDITPTLAYRCLSTLARRENATRHHNDSFTIQRTAVNLWESLKAAWETFLRKLPGVDDTFNNEYSEFMQKVYYNAILKLKAEMSTGEYPAEDISGLISEYQHSVNRLKAADTAQTTTKFNLNLAEVEQAGFSYELETIQEMYDAGLISRATAKHFRDDVRLMQVDINGEE